MKHTVDFYLDELKPKVYYLTLRNTVIAAVLTISVVLIWKLILDNQLQQKQQKLNVVKNQLSASQALLTNKQQELIKHNDKATFNNQKLQLEKTLDAKQMLWDGVGKRLQANTVNYYVVMDELTKHHDHDIWLSRFKFSEDQALFTGFALDSSAVTRWMTYLQSSQSFKGREFSHLNIKAHDQQVLSFEVATDLEAIDKSPLKPDVPAGLPALPAGVVINE